MRGITTIIPKNADIPEVTLKMLVESGSLPLNTNIYFVLDKMKYKGKIANDSNGEPVLCAGQVRCKNPYAFIAAVYFKFFIIF